MASSTSVPFCEVQRECPVTILIALLKYQVQYDIDLRCLSSPFYLSDLFFTRCLNLMILFGTNKETCNIMLDIYLDFTVLLGNLLIYFLFSILFSILSHLLRPTASLYQLDSYWRGMYLFYNYLIFFYNIFDNKTYWVIGDYNVPFWIIIF